jgi:hypothetical protein
MMGAGDGRRVARTDAVDVGVDLGCGAGVSVAVGGGIDAVGNASKAAAVG